MTSFTFPAPFVVKELDEEEVEEFVGELVEPELPETEPYIGYYEVIRHLRKKKQAQVLPKISQ